MKKLLLLVSVAILIVSCSKKNNAPSSIVGKWYLTTDSLSVYVNGSLYEHKSYTSDHQNYTEFVADGSGSEIFIRSTVLGGNAVDDAFAVFTYTVSGNEIDYSFPDQIVGDEQVNAFTQIGTITSHTTNTLSITVTQSVTENGNTYKQVELEKFIK